MPDLTRYWYQSPWHPFALVLLPVSCLFQLVTAIRRACYRIGLIKQCRFAVPVIVVGNVTVGGTGKTPLVIWLANMLRAEGFHPGIVSRGYAGERNASPRLVSSGSSPRQVGDEAVLLARRSGCPVVVSADRVAAVRELLRPGKCDVVISDDGLQHYRLDRAIDIAVVDGERGFGNRYLLPAGPLRESVDRLKRVNFVVVNGGESDGMGTTMTLAPETLISLKTRETRPLSAFRQQKVHAVAGIGYPERFFYSLSRAGLTVQPHPFPDHHSFSKSDLQFGDDSPVIMTEKDAVKCEGFDDERLWCLPVTAVLSDEFKKSVLQLLQSGGGK